MTQQISPKKRQSGKVNANGNEPKKVGHEPEGVRERLTTKSDSTNSERHTLIKKAFGYTSFFKRNHFISNQVPTT